MLDFIFNLILEYKFKGNKKLFFEYYNYVCIQKVLPKQFYLTDKYVKFSERYHYWNNMFNPDNISKHYSYDNDVKNTIISLNLHINNYITMQIKKNNFDCLPEFTHCSEYILNILNEKKICPRNNEIWLATSPEFQFGYIGISFSGKKLNYTIKRQNNQNFWVTVDNEININTKTDIIISLQSKYTLELIDKYKSDDLLILTLDIIDSNFWKLYFNNINVLLI